MTLALKRFSRSPEVMARIGHCGTRRTLTVAGASVISNGRVTPVYFPNCIKLTSCWGRKTDTVSLCNAEPRSWVNAGIPTFGPSRPRHFETLPVSARFKPDPRGFGFFIPASGATERELPVA
jgi:hypothetical protein